MWGVSTTEENPIKLSRGSHVNGGVLKPHIITRFLGESYIWKTRWKKLVLFVEILGIQIMAMRPPFGATQWTHQRDGITVIWKITAASILVKVQVTDLKYKAFIK